MGKSLCNIDHVSRLRTGRGRHGGAVHQQMQRLRLVLCLRLAPGVQDDVSLHSNA